MRIKSTILLRKGRYGVQSLRDQSFYYYQKRWVPAKIPDSICFAKSHLFLPISTPRPNRTWWFGCGWAEGGSVLTLGHAGHYVPICKPIGEVRLICANGALWCTITVRGEADAAQRSYCFFSISFLPSLAQFLVSHSVVVKPVLRLFRIVFRCVNFKAFFYCFQPNI